MDMITEVMGTQIKLAYAVPFFLCLLIGLLRRLGPKVAVALFFVWITSLGFEAGIWQVQNNRPGIFSHEFAPIAYRLFVASLIGIVIGAVFEALFNYIKPRFPSRS